MSLLRRKPVDLLQAESTGSGDGHLNRALGPWAVTFLGVGAVIGAGIFSATGSAIAGGSEHLGAGPAIVVSMTLTAVACALAALCYAEFAAMVPVAGSAYTYSYAALGEVVAWIIGWDLIIEYAIGNVAVAISWSGYFVDLLDTLGLHLPAWLAVDYRTAHQLVGAAGPLSVMDSYRAGAIAAAPHIGGIPIVFNLPAVAIVALITYILIRGVRESAGFNTVMVIVKLGIIAFFVAMGFVFFRPQNLTGYGGFAPNGWRGVRTAASIIFFAYIGFDAVSTAAEETRDPQKNMPFGILMSLVICTVVYILVSVTMTGMAPWNRLGTAEPMLTALELSGGSARLIAISRFIVGIGAVVATTSVLLVFQYGQPRIFFSMGRDGLLPGWASKIHPRFHTPHVTTILTGLFVGGLAAVANINEVVELTNIGTLFAFVLVSLGVLVLRYREPDRPRPFRVPFSPVTEILAALACVYLMTGLPWVTWVRFFVWLAIGAVIYFGYGRTHSRLARSTDGA
jgi:basic amino acid/polyamine antiporter, APA family